MNMKELLEKNDAELVDFLKEKREELRKLRFGIAGSSMRNTKAIRGLRQAIAQTLTELTKREKERKNA